MSSPASVLEFQRPFKILSESLSTLQPGGWLNSEIVVGALLVLEAVCNNTKVRIVYSLNQTASEIDLHETRVLLPMLIHGNHRVLGVYEESVGFLVYESRPTEPTATEAEARRRLAEFLDDKDIQVAITAPLGQTNDHDCGVLAIIAAFHKMTGIMIEPTRIDPAFWRDICANCWAHDRRFLTNLKSACRVCRQRPCYQKFLEFFPSSSTGFPLARASP